MNRGGLLARTWRRRTGGGGRASCLPPCAEGASRRGQRPLLLLKSEMQASQQRSSDSHSARARPAHDLPPKTREARGLDRTISAADRAAAEDLDSPGSVDPHGKEGHPNRELSMKARTAGAPVLHGRFRLPPTPSAPWRRSTCGPDL